MPPSTFETSTVVQNHAALAAEAAEHLGMAQPAAEENSQAKIIQYAAIAPQSTQAHSDHAQQSNTTQQSDQSEDRTCGVTENFTRMVTAAITLGSGSREKSRQALHADYVAAHAYENAGDHKESYKAALKGQCEAVKIKVVDKTTPFHMIVKLTFTDVTKQFVSDKVHVLRVALAMNIEPDGFLKWLEKEKGERKIVETYNRDGSLKSDINTSDSSAITATQARDTHKAACICTLDKDVLQGNGIPSVTVATEFAAIVVRQPDGSTSVKFLVADDKTLDRAYIAFAEQQKTQPVSKPDDVSAARKSATDATNSSGTVDTFDDYVKQAADALSA